MLGLGLLDELRRFTLEPEASLSGLREPDTGAITAAGFPRPGAGEGAVSLTWEDNGCLGSQNLSPRHNPNLRKPWKQFRVRRQISSPNLASVAYGRRCVYRHKEAGRATGTVHPSGSERGCLILNWTGDLVFILKWKCLKRRTRRQATAHFSHSGHMNNKPM